MSPERHPDLVDRLAQRYAVGLLRGGARRRFEALAIDHPCVRERALLWQGRLGAMTELPSAIAVSSDLWPRIAQSIDSEQARGSAAPLRAVGRAINQAALKLDASAQRVLDRSRRAILFWRFLAAVFAIGSLGPLVMALHEGKLRNELQTQLSAVQAALKQSQARQQVQYVAVLNDDQGIPVVLITFDPDKQRLLLQRVGSYTQASDRSLQLWALPPGQTPQSLGVLGDDTIVSLQASAQSVTQAPALAISLEPKGGVPGDKGPTGPVLFKGALLQTRL